MQQSFLSFGVSKESKTKPKICSKEPEYDSLIHTDKEIQEFYNSLTENEAIAHKIAIKLLGTSYDPRRTHGFTKWKRAQLLR